LVEDFLSNYELTGYISPILKFFRIKSNSYHSLKILPPILIYDLSFENYLNFTNSAKLISKSYYAFLGSFLDTSFTPFLAAYLFAILSFSFSTPFIIYFIFSSYSERCYLSNAFFYFLTAIFRCGALSNSIN